MRGLDGAVHGVILGHLTEVSCVAASATLIASADRSGMIRLSRVGTLEPIGQLEAIGASEGVSGLVFAGDDLLLCITGFRTLAVWWLTSDSSRPS